MSGERICAQCCLGAHDHCVCTDCAICAHRFDRAVALKAWNDAIEAVLFNVEYGGAIGTRSDLMKRFGALKRTTA